VSESVLFELYSRLYIVGWACCEVQIEQIGVVAS
jgi:hypothetical protein